MKKILTIIKEKGGKATIKSYRYGFFNALMNPVGDERMIKNGVSLGIGYRF